MPKPIKYNDLYDKPIDGIYPKLKERFLNTISESTRNTYRYILAKAYKMELSLDKDIYEFSWNELDSLIRIYSNRSVQSVIVNVACLRDYINFCIRQGFVRDMVNYLNSLGGEDFKKYVDVRALENLYPTREKMKEIQNRLANARDIVILELLFTGLLSEELFNLKVSDCNFEDKTLTLTKNDGKIRVLDNISDYTMQIIQDAIKENEYIINNGIGNQSAEYKRPEVSKLYNPEFVVKNTREGGFKATSLTNLISQIKINCDEPYLTTTSIRIAGLIDFIKNLGKDELVNKDYEYAMKRFAFEITNVNSISVMRRRIKDYL